MCPSHLLAAKQICFEFIQNAESGMIAWLQQYLLFPDQDKSSFTDWLTPKYLAAVQEAEEAGHWEALTEYLLQQPCSNLLHRIAPVFSKSRKINDNYPSDR